MTWEEVGVSDKQAGRKLQVSMEVTWAGALGRCVDVAGRCYGAQAGEWLLQVPQAGAVKCRWVHGAVGRCYEVWAGMQVPQGTLWSTGRWVQEG